jgi:ADP-glucose pyrophosphorylase
VSKGSLIGCGSSVDTGARLERSIVGSGCHVGRGSVLQASCLHSQVRVDDGCRLSSAVLAEQSVVRSHARVEVRGGMCMCMQQLWLHVAAASFACVLGILLVLAGA